MEPRGLLVGDLGRTLTRPLILRPMERSEKSSWDTDAINQSLYSAFGKSNNKKQNKVDRT